MTTLSQIKNINEYFATNHAEVNSFLFALDGEQAYDYSIEYPQFHLTQPVRQTLEIDTQRLTSQRWTYTVKLYEKMSYNTDLDTREASLTKLNRIANEYIAYLVRFERINAQRVIDPSLEYLDLVSADIVTDSYAREDVNNAVLVQVTLDTRPTADFCDINWVE